MFALASIEREAKNLLKTDAASGWHILGIVAAHRSDEEATRDAFSKALNLDGRLGTSQNFSRALSMLNQYREALEVALKCIERDGADISFLRHAVSCAVRAGAFSTAAELNNRLAKLNATTEFEVDEITDALSRANVEEHEVRARAEVVAEVARQRRVGVSSYAVHVEGDIASIKYVVRASPEIVADMNCDVALELATRFDDPLHRAVVFAYRPA